MDDDDRGPPVFTFELTSGKFSLSSTPEYHITFHFKFELKVTEVISTSGFEILTREIDETIDDSARIVFKIHPGKTANETTQLFKTETSEAITTILACLPVRFSDDERQKLIDFTIMEAQHAAKNSMYEDYEAVDLYILVHKEDQQVHYDTSDYSFMVPARDSSVQLLLMKCDEKKIDSNQNCCVCCEVLSERDADVALLSMPCTHVFHGDCIKKWLKTSHYCPVCRFEMPRKSTMLSLLRDFIFM